MITKNLLLLAGFALLTSCATSVERKDGTIIRFELTGSVGDYLEAGRSFSK
jgi:hypothetical protein